MLTTFSLFAQSYDYSTYDAAASSGSAAVFVVIWLIVILAFSALMLASLWRIYTKAGQPGWAVLVPVYNVYIWLKIVGRPWWWLLLFFIPFVNLIVNIIVLHDMSKAFGKDVAFTVLLFFLPIIGYPMLAWGSAQYEDPSAPPASGTLTPPVAPSAPVPPVV